MGWIQRVIATQAQNRVTGASRATFDLGLLLQTENTVLFRFNWVQLGKISSVREVLSEQPISRCCIDRLSWHDSSGVGSIGTLHLTISCKLRAEIAD